METFSKAACAMAFYLQALSISANGQTTDDPCPDPLGGGAIKSGVYSFEHRSWTWDTKALPKKRDFCTCVRNNIGSPETFISWNKPGLRSWIAPGADIYTCVEYDADDPGAKPKELNSDLFYGVRPDKIVVPTVVPNSRMTFAPEQKTLTLISSDMDVNQADLSRQVTTISKVFLNYHGLLFPTTIIFSSSIPKTNEEEKIIYHCSYRIGNAFWSVGSRSLVLKFNDRDINSTLFGSEGGTALSRNDTVDKIEFEGHFDLSHGEKRPVRILTTNLSVITDDDGSEPANIEISYLK